jgi:endonuclease/exonuclease/phosphatase (EEP) superfamily protein YafD
MLIFIIWQANTHIHANTELKDVKLWQVHTLLKGLEKIAASADIPMLVAGDFNSVPMRSVYIYFLLLNSIQRFRLASVTPYIRRKAL